MVDNKPLLYGKDKDHLLYLDSQLNYQTLVRKMVPDEEWQRAVTQSFHVDNHMMAFALSQLNHLETPFPIGVIYKKSKRQIKATWNESFNKDSLKLALRGKDYWSK